MYNNHLDAFVIYLYVIKIKTEGEGEHKPFRICIRMCEVHGL